MLENSNNTFSTRSLEGFTGLRANPYDMRDMSKLSLCRAILSVERGENCLEKEVGQDVKKRSGLSANIDSLCFPLRMAPPTTGLRGDPRSAERIYNSFRPQFTRTAGDLQVASTLGTELVYVQPMTFIEMLRNATVCGRMGATFLSDLVGPITFPSQTSAGTLAWTTEASGSDVTDSFMAFGTVKLVPKSAQSSTGYTRQLLAQASYDVEAIVRADLVAINALGLDFAALCGPGTGGSPKGIMATAGIGSVAIGTNGGPPTYSSILNLQTALFKNNVAVKSPGYVTTPGVRGYCMQTPIVANFPSMIWRDPNTLAGYPAAVSNQLPSTLTKGTSSGNCHAAIFGNWQDLLIGEWGVLEIIVDPYRLKKQGIIEITSFIMVDVGLRYPVSFAADLDLIPTY